MINEVYRQQTPGAEGSTKLSDGCETFHVGLIDSFDFLDCESS